MAKPRWTEAQLAQADMLAENVLGLARQAMWFPGIAMHATYGMLYKAAEDIRRIVRDERCRDD